MRHNIRKFYITFIKPILILIRKILRYLFNMSILIRRKNVISLPEIRSSNFKINFYEKKTIYFFSRRKNMLRFFFYLLPLNYFINIYSKLVNLGYFYLAQKLIDNLKYVKNFNFNIFYKFQFGQKVKTNFLHRILLTKNELKTIFCYNSLITYKNTNSFMKEELHEIFFDKTICIVGPLDIDKIDFYKFDIYVFFNNYLNLDNSLNKKLDGKIKIGVLNGKFSERKDEINKNRIYDYLLLKLDIDNKKKNEFFIDFNNEVFTLFNSLNMLPISLVFILLFSPKKISIFNFDLRLSRYKKQHYGDLSQNDQFESIPTFGHNPACNFIFLEKIYNLKKNIIEINNNVVKKLLSDSDLYRYLIMLQNSYGKKNYKKIH